MSIDMRRAVVIECCFYRNSGFVTEHRIYEVIIWKDFAVNTSSVFCFFRLPYNLA